MLRQVRARVPREPQIRKAARWWPAGKTAPRAPSSYLVTSGAEVGWTCFMMVWIQFRRIPDVMAESVNSPSLVYTKDELFSVTITSSPQRTSSQVAVIGALRAPPLAPE